jgi:uncharacterized protein YqeY
MTLQEKIRADLVVAMKAKEEPKLTVLRGLITLCTNELTATKRTPKDTLSDDEVLALITRSVKQRHDAAEQFRKGAREDLVKKEDAESVILTHYLPAQMSREEVIEFVQKKINEMGAIDRSKTGMFVGAIMKDLKGRVDGGTVKSVVEELLA